jgi:hypothetical protein
MFLEEPARALPRAKIPRDASITGRLPKASARAPESGIKAVPESEYDDPTQTKSSAPWRSATMVGRATPIAV